MPIGAGAEASLSRKRNSSAGAFAAVIVAVLLAVEVTRLTVASAVADDNPDRAGRLAPAMPAALAAQAMAQVGKAAAAGGNPDPQTFERLQRLARTAPFATEPFLVEAALAERAGDYDRAHQLLTAARSREPRSVAARYLYADVAIRQGRIVEGLGEMAILSRLLPAASIQLIPALAQYARVPSSRANLMEILENNPRLRPPLLIALSSDPANADLVLSLAASAGPMRDKDRITWQSRLVQGFIGRGDFDRAYSLWHQFAGLPSGDTPLLFNGDFKPVSVPGPFSWRFSSSEAGISEPDNGKLRIVYYGRDDTTLAAQLLKLPAGKYRLEGPVAGEASPGALGWSISCVGAKAPLMDIDVTADPTAGSFVVPSSQCPVQWLELDGHGMDVPQETDVSIGPIQLEKVSG